MRSALGNAVRKEFDRRIKDRFPQFRLLPDDHIYPGDRLYCWEKEAHLSFYIRLVIDPKGSRDALTVELGWSRTGRPPAYHSMNHQNDLKRDSAYFRLSSFWSSVDPWWELWHDSTLENLLGELQNSTEAELLARIKIDPEIERRFGLAYGNEEPIENILPKIPSVIDDVFGRLREFAVPFFDGFPAQ